MLPQLRRYTTFGRARLKTAEYTIIDELAVTFLQTNSSKGLHAIVARMKVNDRSSRSSVVPWPPPETPASMPNTNPALPEHDHHILKRRELVPVMPCRNSSMHGLVLLSRSFAWCVQNERTTHVCGSKSVFTACSMAYSSMQSRG